MQFSVMLSSSVCILKFVFVFVSLEVTSGVLVVSTSGGGGVVVPAEVFVTMTMVRCCDCRTTDVMGVLYSSFVFPFLQYSWRHSFCHCG